MTLQRKTPMRRSPLLRSGQPLGRGSVIRQQSARRQRQNRERRVVIAELAVDGPTICPVPGCTNVADSPHEPLTRSRGGSITDPANIRLICWTHNQELTMEPSWGYELGFLVHSWEA